MQGKWERLSADYGEGAEGGRGKEIAKIKRQKYRLKGKNRIDNAGRVFIIAGELGGICRKS